MTKQKQQKYHLFSEDYANLLQKPVALEEFRKRYQFQIIPLKHQYDLFLLLHLHRKQLEKLQAKLESAKA